MSDTAFELQRMYNASAQALEAVEEVVVHLLLMPEAPAPERVADTYNKAITAICHLTGETREAARKRMARRAVDEWYPT